MVEQVQLEGQHLQANAQAHHAMQSCAAYNKLASPLTILVGMGRAKLVPAHIDAVAELGVRIHRPRLPVWLLGCMQAAHAGMLHAQPPSTAGRTPSRE